MKMTILQAGPMTTIQDAGRFGFMQYGIGQSGVMDYKSFIQANELVGNRSGEAVLEMTLFGAELVCDEDVLIAYTGADMQAQIDNQDVERGRAYWLKKGAHLKFGFAKLGVRAYLAVAGQMQIENVMNSKSTNMKCHIGGMQGRKLQNGDEIEWKNTECRMRKISKLLKKRISQEDYSGEKEIRVVLGSQADLFTEKGISTFLNEKYKISSDSDRMGIRMVGPTIDGLGNTDIISDGIVFGSIQVTSAGQPIVMMADHQTTGGYAKIATVITEDLPILAQIKPGEYVKFKAVNIQQIQKKGRFVIV